MSGIQQVICVWSLLSVSCISLVICRPQLRPFEYQRKTTAESKTEVGANSKPFATVESRSLNDDGSLSIEEAAISILFQLKIFPFRKAGIDCALDAREDGDMSKDNSAWGAGIDVGLPGGSGFGYGIDASFKHFHSVPLPNTFK